VSVRPAPDEEHAYGHTKAEFFSAALEGALLLAAAVFIAATALKRLLDPQPLENLGMGLAVSVVAAALNGTVGVVLMRAGGRMRSAALRADGRHFLTGVWTTAGVAGVLLVGLTVWLVLDPLIALVVRGLASSRPAEFIDAWTVRASITERLRFVDDLALAGVEHAGPSEAGPREEVGRQEEQGVQGIREGVARVLEACL
jgi:Co/Zn/Cd efflux system component